MTCDFLMELIINSHSDKFERFDINYNNEIVCNNAEDADCVADFLEVLGFKDVHTSEFNGEYFVYID